jgi:hypothetical protein
MAIVATTPHSNLVVIDSFYCLLTHPTLFIQKPPHQKPNRKGQAEGYSPCQYPIFGHMWPYPYMTVRASQPKHINK